MHLLCDRSTGRTPSRLRRCRADRTSRTRRFIPVTAKFTSTGERGAQMFDHPIAFVGLGCKQELVDYSGSICLLAQAGDSLLQSLGALRFVARGDIQGIGAW
jgi:hypothetical protein